MSTPIPLRNRLAGLAILIVAVLFFSWYGMTNTCGCASVEDGILEGTVTIGPLCPVEPCEAAPDLIAEAYRARQVIVSRDGTTIVRKLSIDPGTGYRTTLPPGRYVVDINYAGIDSSSDVPREVTILPGQTAVIDIAIDTGIR